MHLISFLILLVLSIYYVTKKCLLNYYIDKMFAATSEKEVTKVCQISMLSVCYKYATNQVCYQYANSKKPVC